MINMLSKTKVEKECPPGKILNPKTNYCVDINGPTGKKILKNQLKTDKPKVDKLCPPGKILNPKTNYCVDINGPTGKKILKNQLKTDKPKVEKSKVEKPTDDKSKVLKECPPGKILNPKTNYCVDINGPTGKKILKNQLKVNKNKVEKPTDDKSKVLKECPPGKILNPKTNYCVDINGPTGKKILKNQLKTDKPKIEKPKVEKPKIDKPKVDKPKVEKPKVEKPKIEKTNTFSAFLKNNFKQYPLNHSFDKNAIQKFIQAADPSVQDICRKIIDNTEYISFEKMLIRLNSNINDLLEKTKDSKILYFYLGQNITSLYHKSNYWLYNYIIQYIKFKSNIQVKLITNINFISEDNANIVLIDDCIYSGSQMGITISNISYVTNFSFNFYLLIPYMSESGKKHIKLRFELNKILKTNNCKLIFLDYISYIKSINSVLNVSEILKLQYFYNSLVSLNNKYLIYFDHKLADTVSTITPFYLGIVPCKDNIGLGSIYTANSGSIIKLPLNQLNKYKIIPIIKNCEEYTNNIDLMSPKCPAPPYKKGFDIFIKNKKKENKKFKSLSNNSNSNKKNKKHLSY